MYFLLSNETRHNLSKPKKLADVSNKTKQQQQQQQSINPRIRKIKQIICIAKNEGRQWWTNVTF